MKQKIAKRFTYWLEVAAIGIVLGLILQGARAWTEPSASPPGGNLGAPINTGNAGQVKQGPLGVNSDGIIPTGLLVTGNVGIGTLAPTTPAPNAQPGNLDVNDVYLRSIGKWESQGTWYVPSDVKTTTATHNGNFGGYQGIYNWIQTNGCSGYHVCDNTELTRYYQTHATTDINGWYNTGTYSPARDSGYNDIHIADCEGWSYSGGDYKGALWAISKPSGYWEGYCANVWKVVCCK